MVVVGWWIRIKY